MITIANCNIFMAAYEEAGGVTADRAVLIFC